MGALLNGSVFFFSQHRQNQTEHLGLKWRGKNIAQGPPWWLAHIAQIANYPV